ncbi:MAG TPA: ATP-binding protein [Thermoanaerobaculia bacterium]|nr:ATP-binding protein [Thermoanaerobaculia bacterium]
MSLAPTVAGSGESSQHVVQFYERDEYLYGRVAEFLAAGVLGGEPALVIATDEHRRGIAAALDARGIDSAALTFADAHAMLAMFMRDGMPDPALFRAAVRQLAGAPVRLRAYGEMVDVLCRQGSPKAAVRLEELWNDLGRDLTLSLLCAYPLSGFNRGAHARLFDEVCAMHSRVMPAEGLGDADGRAREIARLQQRSAALEAEMEARALLLEAVTTLHRSLDAGDRARELAALIVPRMAEGCIIAVGPEVVTVGTTSGPALTVSIQFNERALGTLSLHGARCDEALALDLARHAAIAFENARLYHLARDANRTKDEFMATLSHELRTPLTAILGWARMLSMGLDETMARTAVETIERSALTQAALVDDLLDVSRIVTGKLVLRREPFDVSTAIRNAVQTLHLAAEARGVGVEITQSEPAMVMGDSTRVQQIVWNLLGNAIKFSKPEGRVRVEVERDADSVRIHVRDEGCGIAPAFLPHVFEPFRQADGATTRSYGGLGLGLAIVKYVAELHGGSVAAHSDGPDRGATFTVTLPLWSAAALAAAFER